MRMPSTSFRQVRECLPTILLFLGLSSGAALLPDTCGAQDLPLSAGDRIRVKPLIEPRDRLTGTLLSVDEDSLSLRAEGGERAFALTDLEYVRVSTGEESHLAGTIVGGVMGAAFGAFLGSAIEQGVDDDCFDYCGLAGGYYGFIFGGLAGGIGGYLWLGKEQWANVPVEDLRVGIGARGVRLELGL